MKPIRIGNSDSMKSSRLLKSILLIQCVCIVVFYIFYVRSRPLAGGLLEQFRAGSNCPSVVKLLAEVVHESELHGCSMDDPALIAYFRFRHIRPPSTSKYPFKTQKPTAIMKVLWPLIQKQVANKSNPFFVEAGANDGLDFSNTIWLEETHGWSGLLVECHPEVLPKLYQNHRKAYISDACLARDRHFSTDTLTSVDGWHPSSSMGSGDIWPDFAKKFTKFEIQTFPLYTMLASLGVRVVDFISLDIQSLELQVLRTFPFDLILVKVWVIEIILLSPDDKAELLQLMTSNGYIVSKMLEGGISDLVFIHRGPHPSGLA